MSEEWNPWAKDTLAELQRSRHTMELALDKYPRDHPWRKAIFYVHSQINDEIKRRLAAGEPE